MEISLLFAVILDLRYSYYLEKGEMEKAADCINRLAYVQAYLPPVQVEKIAAELMYMHVMNGDLARAEECGDMCREFLKGNTVTAKRVAHFAGSLQTILRSRLSHHRSFSNTPLTTIISSLAENNRQTEPAELSAGSVSLLPFTYALAKMIITLKL